MPRVDVVHADKGKFKVLVNHIQQGIEYNTQVLANSEANKIRKELKIVYKKN